MSRVRLVRAWGPSTSPTACAPAGRRCALWGWREGVPGGGAFRRCEGRLRSGAPAPLTARPLGGLSGSTTDVLWARVCGCGGPALSPWLACPVVAACSGGGGRPSPGEVTCHCCEGRLVSGAVPPLADRRLGQAAGVPRPVCPGCGWCGRGDPAPAPQRASLRAGVARCGGGGRASPGGWLFTVVRGVWGQALPLPRLPALRAGCWGPPPPCFGRGCSGVAALHWPRGSRALWGAARRGDRQGRLGSGAPPSRLPALWAGCRSSLATCCGRRCGCVRCVWCLCDACRGAWCCPSSIPMVPPSPVLCCGVVLAVCLPCLLPCARPLLGCWLPSVSFVVSSLFTVVPVARSQRRKRKNEEIEAQSAKKNGKIAFSDLRNPPQIFTPLLGEVENGRTLTGKRPTKEPPRRES